MSLKYSLFAGLALSMLISGTAIAADTDPVVMASPAKDGAYVVKLGGLANNIKIATLDGGRKTIDDGIVIRKSYVKDGKAIIPAGGLYTTSRCSNWWSFNDHTFTMNGKIYHFIVDEYQMDVVKNVTMKPGQVIFGNAEKTRGWELSSISKDGYGIDEAYSASFKIVKTTGNYYGGTFDVTMGKNIVSYADDGLSADAYKEGTTCWSEQKDTKPFIGGKKVAVSGRSQVYVNSLTPTEAKVDALVTVSTKNALISPNAPVIGVYGKGETVKVGNATVKVLDVAADSATLEITDAKGTVTKMIAATKAEMELLPASRVVTTALYGKSASGKEVVHANIHNKDGVFANGKVALVGYSDVIEITNGGTWATDDRFITRPEICASCTFIHEISVENAKPIVLDAKNNTYVGPDGYFKIVIDKINGDTVEAWHIETAKDKTANLAGRSKGKHIDAVVGAACRSTAHFFSRVYAQLYKEAVAQ